MTVPAPRQPAVDNTPRTLTGALAALHAQADLLVLDAPMATAAARPRVQRDAAAVAALLASLRLPALTTV